MPPSRHPPSSLLVGLGACLSSTQCLAVRAKIGCQSKVSRGRPLTDWSVNLEGHRIASGQDRCQWLMFASPIQTVKSARSRATLSDVSKPVARGSPEPLAPVHGPTPTGSKGLTALQFRGDIPSAMKGQDCPPSLVPSAKQCGVEGHQHHHRGAAPPIHNDKKVGRQNPASSTEARKAKSDSSARRQGRQCKNSAKSVRTRRFKLLQGTSEIIWTVHCTHER